MRWKCPYCKVTYPETAATCNCPGMTDHLDRVKEPWT